MAAIAGSGRTAGQHGGTFLALLAVAAFSTAPALVLWAKPLSPFEVTVGRLITAALVVMGLARRNGQPLFPRRADLPRFALFGLVTAVHFASYIASLGLTTIAHALAIVYTAPVFVTLFSAWFLHETVALRKWAGVLVTVAGIAVLAGFEARLDARMALGDLLALVSAITFGIYSVGGRSQRERYGLFTYAGTVYGLAALWALPLAVLSFTPSAYSPTTLMAVLGAGLVPLAAGHTLYNAAVRRMHATIPTLIATQEVTGGIILGMLFFSQVPQANEIVGAGIALLGIALVLI